METGSRLEVRAFHVTDAAYGEENKITIDGHLTVCQETAKEIIRGAFRLENPHCPHGRPIWFRLTRTELFKLVGRLV